MGKGRGGRGRRRRRERERGPAYTYLAYSMIGRRLITIEIGSRVAIPTRVTAPARASTCIIKFTVIDLFTERPPPPSPSARVILASCVPGLGHHTMVVPQFSVSWKGRWEGKIGEAENMRRRNLYFSRRAERLHAIFLYEILHSDASRRRGNGSDFLVGSTLNTPATRDLDVKVEDSLGSLSFLPTETNYRFVALAPPRPPDIITSFQLFGLKLCEYFARGTVR